MKTIVMQRTIDYILSNHPEKIRDIEALGTPSKVEFEDKINDYFKFE